MDNLEHGSCHCGAIRFDYLLDRSQSSLRCNCSYCLKVRSWAVLAPADRFKLVAGTDSLSAYEFGARRERHYFCRRCGVRIYGQGEPPGRPAYVTVNLACLDSLTEQELAALPVRYIDGRHDRWDAAPGEMRHL